MAHSVRFGAHPLALFSLAPINDNARAVLAHSENIGYVSTFAVANAMSQCLDIGFNIGSKKAFTLATLGRSGADITVEGSSISAIHCSFEIHQESGEIMLHDLSRFRTTQTSGENATPFEERQNPRRIVVGHNLNTRFGIGGLECDLVQFRLVWHERLFDVMEQVRNRPCIPRLAPTIAGSDIPTQRPSAYVTQNQTPIGQELRLRYAERFQLGKGAFGEVWKAVNIDTGKYLAVKIIVAPPLGFGPRILELLKREVHVLSQTSHVS